MKVKVNPEAIKLRAKKLGVLLRNARVAAGKSEAECAQALCIPEKQYQLYEIGDQSPSLPEMEALAYLFDTPLEQFWSSSRLIRQEEQQDRRTPEQLPALRQRIIGVQVRQARVMAGLPLEELANRVGMSSIHLREAELGESSIPLPVLESLANELNRPFRDFYDRYGPVGTWIFRQKAVDDFLKMPADLQSFVSKPINRPYLELAQRLSEMSVDRLRTVAEGLLEITL